MMGTNDVATWMLDEHARVHELSGELRARVTGRPRGDHVQWIADLRSRFDELATRLRRHASFEETGGYLTHVVERRPTLSQAVDIIRREHQELGVILRDLQASIHELAPTDNLLLRDCCRRVEHFLYWVERHEEHENHLVLCAFTQDIGAVD
jgi:hemerythrin-like domain-containing protein